MSFGITKTIPAKAGVEALDSLYDGSRAEYEFHMAGKNPTRLKVGDYVYTIFGDQLHGRLKIREFITGAVNPNSGKPRILVIVDGRVVEEGLHEQLIDLRGEYYKLYQMQYGDNQLQKIRTTAGGADSK